MSIEIRHKDTGAVVLRYQGWSLKSGTLRGAGLRGVDLKVADLEGAELSAADLEAADLTGAVMRRARLDVTRFRRANLQSADLQEAFLERADLTEANLEGANLLGSDLTGACLLGTTLREARLDGANMACAYYDERTEWPVGFQPEVRGALCLGHPIGPPCENFWKNWHYGPHLAIEGGSIVEPGESEYRHRFGGASWRVVDPQSVYGGPTLLLTLDLLDPQLAAIQMPGVRELPLASYLNSSVYAGDQWFRIEPETQTLLLLQREIASPEPLPEAMWFPDPLPETRVRLRPMSRADWPIDHESYCQLESSFLGGSGFIRVLGPPLWVDEMLPVTLAGKACGCGGPMHYVSGIGYEVDRTGSGQPPSSFIPGRLFFLGEMALYFLLCTRCRQILVAPQAV